MYNSLCFNQIITCISIKLLSFNIFRLERFNLDNILQPSFWRLLSALLGKDNLGLNLKDFSI